MFPKDKVRMLAQRGEKLQSPAARLRHCFQTGASLGTLLRVRKNANLYLCGDCDESVCLLESGLVKLLMPSHDGKQCLLTVCAPGDVFGETSLAVNVRIESAAAMTDAWVRQIPGPQFLAHLTQEGLLEELIRHLTLRLTEHRIWISRLLTFSSEARLAITLLQIARKLGCPEPGGWRIVDKLTQEELSEMVGTTRSRIGYFLNNFRRWGLIEFSHGGSILVKEQALTAYVEAGGKTQGAGRRGLTGAGA